MDDSFSLYLPKVPLQCRSRWLEYSLSPCVFFFQIIQQMGVAKPYLSTSEPCRQLWIPPSLESDFFSKRVTVANAGAYPDRSFFSRLLIGKYCFLSECTCYRNNPVGTQERLQVNEESFEGQVQFRRFTRSVWLFFIDFQHFYFCFYWFWACFWPFNVYFWASKVCIFGRKLLQKSPLPTFFATPN